MPPKISRRLRPERRQLIKESPSTTEVKVLYDFDGDPDNGELSIRAGEELTVTAQDIGDGWWEARNSLGHLGLIPEAYIQFIPPPPERRQLIKESPSTTEASGPGRPKFGPESAAMNKTVLQVNQQKEQVEKMDTSGPQTGGTSQSQTPKEKKFFEKKHLGESWSQDLHRRGTLTESPSTKERKSPVRPESANRNDDTRQTARNPWEYRYSDEPRDQSPKRKYGMTLAQALQLKRDYLYHDEPRDKSPDRKNGMTFASLNPYPVYPHLAKYPSADRKDDMKDTAKIISAQAASTNSCVFCDNKGVFYCYECKSPFCKPCRVNHDKLPPSKKHSVIDLKSVNPSTVTRICELHESEYTFYCTPCNILVCNICVTSDHKEHGMAGIIEKSNELKILAKSKLSDMKCKLQNLSKVAEKTKIIHIPKLDNESEIAVDKIRSIENDLQKLISTKADIKVNEVQDAAQWKKEELQSVLKNKERIHRKQTAVYESLETLLSEEHAVSFLVSYQTIKRDMCDLTNEAKDDIEPYHTRAPDLKGFLDETIKSLQEYRKRLE